jgi:hypothetical protein
MAQQRVNGVNLYDEDRGDGAPIVLIHGRRRRTSVSRVRENRMPGSMRRREESGTSRARTCRTVLAPPADPTARGGTGYGLLVWQKQEPVVGASTIASAD